MPDELKRHSLSDGGTGSYSTNLDRNRYGNDDQYLSTVIRYDLEFLVGGCRGTLLLWTLQTAACRASILIAAPDAPPNAGDCD